MNIFNKTRFIVTLVLITLLISMTACSSDSNDTKEKSKSNDTEEISITATSGFTYWYYLKWNQEYYTDQTQYRNNGESYIEVTGEDSSLSPENEANRRIEKFKEMGYEIEVIDNKEWNNENVSGWVINLEMTNQSSGDEFELTEIILSSDRICRFSFRDYGDGTITKQEFEKIINDIGEDIR